MRTRVCVCVRVCEKCEERRKDDLAGASKRRERERKREEERREGVDAVLIISRLDWCLSDS